MAVFLPRALRKQEIIKQGGWHIRGTLAGSPPVTVAIEPTRCRGLTLLWTGKAARKASRFAFVRAQRAAAPEPKTGRVLRELWIRLRRGMSVRSGRRQANDWFEFPHL